MTGRGRVVVAAALVVASCSSGPSTPAPKPASANRAACTSWKKFLDDLASTPNIVALSRSELSDSMRRETLERVVAAATTGSLHDDLLLDADIRSALRKAMVAEWGDANGERLNETAAAAGYAYIRDYLMRDRLAVGRRRIARGDAIRLYSAVRRRMAVLCGTARPLRLSTLAISGPLPADVVGVQLGEGHLVRIGRRDGRLVPRPVPEGWKATGQTEALAGGRRLAFVGTNDPKGRVDVLVGAVLDLGSARPVTAATLNAPCFDWSPSEDRMAVSVGFGRPDQRMQVIDAGGAIADVPVQGVDPVDLCRSHRPDTVGCPQRPEGRVRAGHRSRLFMADMAGVSTRGAFS